MAYKTQRLERIIEREIGTILLNSKDDRLKFITITKVNLTSDGSIATVFYTIIGNENQIEATTKSFENALGYIRSSLGKKLEVKKVPELKIRYDESMEYGARIENILKEINKDK